MLSEPLHHKVRQSVIISTCEQKLQSNYSRTVSPDFSFLNCKKRHLTLFLIKKRLIETDAHDST